MKLYIRCLINDYSIINDSSDKYHKTCCLLSLPNVVAMVDLGPLLIWVRIEFDH